MLSIEISNRYFQFAKLRLGELTNVSLYRGTSVDVLETDEFKARVGKNPFIYPMHIGKSIFPCKMK